MNIDFTGRRVLVTGAAHGFGRAIAKAFADRGAKVHIADILPDELEKTAELCGPTSQTHILDVSDHDSVQACIKGIEQAGDPIEILVNNAGGVCGQVGQPIENVTPEQWQKIFGVNLTGAFNMAQAVVPAMKAAGYGRIINISSGAGITVSLTGIQAYASAKAGQIGLTRQLAHELGQFGITVNNVAPGFVRSNPSTEKQWEAMGEEGQQKLISNIATRKLGSVDDIAHAVLFFASNYAGWVTGQILSVDGGK